MSHCSASILKDSMSLFDTQNIENDLLKNQINEILSQKGYKTNLMVLFLSQIERLQEKENSKLRILNKVQEI
jgi:hypothetical protein